MKVTYIHHSSFLAELDQAYLLFDYYEGNLPAMDGGKPLYVFASHSHGDHFSPVIFELGERDGAAAWILSKDIPESRIPVKYREKVTWMNYGEERDVDGIHIETFQSTDQGVAFLLTCHGASLYHAGDLNNWWWEGESKAWNHNMAANYKREMEKLRGRSVDVAFVPLDPRQEQWFYLGMEEFMKNVEAKAVFPMHFWRDYSIIDRMKARPESETYGERIQSIHREGEEFIV